MHGRPASLPRTPLVLPVQSREGSAALYDAKGSLVSFVEHGEAVAAALNFVREIAVADLEVWDLADLQLQADQIVRRMAQ